MLGAHAVQSRCDAPVIHRLCIAGPTRRTRRLEPELELPRLLTVRLDVAVVTEQAQVAGVVVTGVAVVVV